MNFGEALSALHDGRAIRRHVWPDGMYLLLVPGSVITVAADRPPGKALPHLVGQEVRYGAHIDLLLPNGRMGPWNAMDEELTATDWEANVTDWAPVEG